MSSISVDKPLAPGQDVTIIISMSFFGYSKDMEFKFKVPNAAPLLSRVDNITLDTKPGIPKEKTKGDYPFSRYEKGGSAGKNFYKLKIRLNAQKNANELIPGEKVNLSSSSPTLAALHNKNYEVIADSNKNKNYVYLRVPNTDQPTTNSGTVTGSLQEITGIVKTRIYTVTIPNKVFNGLISERIPGKQAQEGMIEDIPIYAYKRFIGNNTVSVKRKLMNNADEINEKEPPDRNVVASNFIGKKSFSKDFILNGEDKFIFYVAIARYIYDGEKWTKQWLQTDSSDRAIWGKAVQKR